MYESIDFLYIYLLINENYDRILPTQRGDNMETINQTFEDEKQYLNEVQNILFNKIETSQVFVDNQQKKTEDFKKMIWNSRGELSDYEYNIQFNEIDDNTNSINEQIKTLQTYKKSLNSPYFGRIDFSFDGKTIPIYVGITSLKDNNYNYIFDWRAPISSMFYNYTIGKAEYEAPRGTISGNIELRRQYKIEDGILHRMIENDINIDDDILQEVLSNSSTDKMKNIVTTIQKEQNEIIRNTANNNVIVQGIAGSGKTSVALHRIAYLLYQYEELNSDNILIFSPNDIFTEYISEVLPTLGEENVLGTTFSELSREYIKKNNKIQSFAEFLENYYNNNIEYTDFIMTKFKQSDCLKETIDRFLNHYIKSHKLNEDIEINIGNIKTIDISKEEINKLFHSRYVNLKVLEKLELISKQICDSNNINYNRYGVGVRNQIKKKLDLDLDMKKMYQKFLDSEYYKSNFNFDIKKSKSSNIIKYEDLIGMLYLHFELNGYPYNTKVKHIVIDEAQDYSKLQLYIIKQMFPKATFTILGDINQTINPYYKYDSLSELVQVFGVESQYFELSKSYRSSPEIVNYSNNILDINNSISIRKDNDLPVICEQETDNLNEQLYNSLLELKQKNFKRIAIVTKNNSEADELSQVLKTMLEDLDVEEKVLILPSYMAKGLEFDGVILYTKPDNYYNEQEKNLYYVACTRAQHQLIVYNQPQMTLNKNKTLVKKTL